MGDDLVVARKHEAGELDLGDRAEAVRGHADGASDDRGFGDRGVEDTVDAVLLLEACGDAEDAAFESGVLAEDDDVLVIFELLVECLVDGV